jgi:hypothetical protein
MKIFPYPIHKNQNKCTKDLNTKHDSIKLLDENIEKMLPDITLGNDFLDMTQKAQATKAKIDNWDYMRLKSFLWKRQQLTECRDNLGSEREYLQSMYLTKG